MTTNEVYFPPACAPENFFKTGCFPCPDDILSLPAKNALTQYTKFNTINPAAV